MCINADLRCARGQHPEHGYQEAAAGGFAESGPANASLSVIASGIVAAKSGALRSAPESSR